MELWKLFAVIGIVIVIGVFFLALHKTRAQKKRAKIFEKKIQVLLNKIKKLPESQNNQKILEYDKILDLCLYEKISGRRNVAGKTTGEKMKYYDKKHKSSEKNFLSTNNIWFAHKMRNKISHEIGYVPHSADFKKAQKIFLDEITKLIEG